MIKKILVTALTASVLYLLLWPTPIDPAAWQAPENKGFHSPFALNERLASASVLDVGGAGPEDFAVDSSGILYTGLLDGRVLRIDAASATVEEIVNTGGRPLGMEFDAAGNLIIADAVRGLISLAPDRKIEVLTTTAGGRPFGFADDLDIAADGRIYFSDASSRFGVNNYRNDALEHRPNGRVLVYDPVSKTTQVLVDSLYFANGIAVDPSQRFLLFAETWEYRVWRYWLAGEKQGQKEKVFDNLPGFPDNIAVGTDGLYWLGFTAPRLKIVDFLADKPFLREVVWRLPLWVQPKPVQHGFVIGFTADGEIRHNLQDTLGETISSTSGALFHDGRLYVNSLDLARIAWLDLRD